MFRRSNILGLVLMAVVLSGLATSTLAQPSLTAKVTAPVAATSAVVENDRTRDGLVGPVRRVRTEIVKLSSETGKLAEGKHTVLEIVAYDIKGVKVENQYFPIAGANLTGKEVYKYDEKGNISEMILTNDDGSLISKEIYKYEFDFVGNWNKMSTSVAVIDAGKMSFEPTEVTYRSIMYYLDEKMLRMAQPAAAPASSPAVSTAAASNNTSGPAGEMKNASLSPIPSPIQKSATVPSALKTSDKLNGAGSVEVGILKSPSMSTPVVKFDAEPPPPSPRPILKPVSGGVLNGIAVSLPSPIYPEAARRLRVSGAVSVEVVIDETGKVISAQASSGPAALQAVAVQAALRARFSPTKLSGQPVKVAGTISYKFIFTP